MEHIFQTVADTVDGGLGPWSDLERKVQKSIKINGGNTQTSHLLCSEGSPGKAVRTSWLLLKLSVIPDIPQVTVQGSSFSQQLFTN